MLEEKIFELLFIELPALHYGDICSILGIGRKQLREHRQMLSKSRSTEIDEIKRLKQLYHNKSNGTDFKFGSFKSFHDWYVEQDVGQNGRCYYCKTSYEDLKAFYSSHESKRLKRGKSLE